MTPWTGARPRFGAPDVPYLNCRECGLSIRSRDPLTDRTFCPRCRARGRREALIRAPLPLRLMRHPSDLHTTDTPATR